MLPLFCFCILIINAYANIESTQTCSVENDCLNDCARNPMCSNDFCSYSSYKSEGRFCLTDNYDLSTCDGQGVCNNIEEPDPEESNPKESDPEESEPCESTERHRKPWHMITDEERNLYITGFKELHKKGKITKFSAAHSSENTLNQAHTTSSFLPWHRYFIWELETQIRNLGGEYKCFSLPLWDSTHETQHEGNYYILSSGLGESGLSENNYCVEDGPFARSEYMPPNCPEQGDECCLQRNARSWTQTRFLTPQEMLKYITDYAIYGDDNIINSERIDGFGRNVEGTPHGTLHVVIGGSGHLGQVARSPDDPIFYLLHASVDYLWALWQDCYDFDQVEAKDITQDIYHGLGTQIDSKGVIYGPSGIDDELNFDDLQNVEWSLVSHTRLTPRDMHNIRDWDVSYEKGDFYERAKVDELDDLCLTINPDWFYNTIQQTEPETAAEIFADDTFTFLKYKQFHSEENRNREILDSWSIITCEYNEFSLNEPCYRPKYFNDCGSDPKYQNVDGDIDITLDELLERVKTSKCMMETRKMYYEWAKKTRMLMDLCNGVFDHFCDNQFLKQQQEQEKQSIINIENNNINHDDNNKSIIALLIISLLILTVFGLICYIKKLKKQYKKKPDIILEQEMMRYYGSTTKKKEVDSF